MLSFIGDDEQREEELKIQATSSSKKEIENAEEIQSKLRSSKAETRQFEKRIDKDFKNTADLLEQYNQLRDSMPSSYDNIKQDMDETSQSLIEQFQLYEDAETARKNVLAETMHKVAQVISNNPAQRMEQLATSAATYAQQGAYWTGWVFGLAKNFVQMFGSGIERLLMNHPYEYPKSNNEGLITSALRKMKNTVRHVGIMLYNIFGGDMEDDWDEFKENEHKIKKDKHEKTKNTADIEALRKRVDNKNSTLSSTEKENAEKLLAFIDIQDKIKELDKAALNEKFNNHYSINGSKKISINDSFADWINKGYVDIDKENNGLKILDEYFLKKYTKKPSDNKPNNFKKLVDYKYKRFLLDGMAYNLLDNSMKFGDLIPMEQELSVMISNAREQTNIALSEANDSVSVEKNSEDYANVIAKLVNTNPKKLNNADISQLMLAMYNNEKNSINSDNYNVVTGQNFDFYQLYENSEKVIDNLINQQIDDNNDKNKKVKTEEATDVKATYNEHDNPSVDFDGKEKETKQKVSKAILDVVSTTDYNVEQPKQPDIPNYSLGVISSENANVEPDTIVAVDNSNRNEDFLENDRR